MWPEIVIWVATALLSYALAPKPKLEQPKAAGLDEFQAPVATEAAP